MYNNLPQQAPAYYYVPQNYQRAQTVGLQEPQTASPASLYSAPIMLQNNYIKGRPVVSIDEARASQIDLDGSLYVFPDLGNKRIYTKQINLDGTASFNIFELKVIDEPAEGPVYVTRDELDQIIEQLKASLVAPKAAQTKPAANFNL